MPDDRSRGIQTTTVSRVLALLLIGVLVEREALVETLIAQVESPDPILLLVTMLWLALLLGSFVGLLLQRRWGAALLLTLVPASTALQAIPLIPGVSRLLPPTLRPEAMLVLNLLVGIAAVVLLRRLPARRAGIGGERVLEPG